MTRGKAKEIAGYLHQRIEAGEYDRGGKRQKLPKVRDLAEEFSTTRATIDRAIRLLETNGLLDLVHGSGIYVRRQIAIERDLDKDTRSEFRRALAGEPGPPFEEMTGVDDVAVRPDYERRPPPEPVARLLHLGPDEPVLERVFRYSIEGVPHQIARSYMPTPLADAAGLKSPEAETKGVGTIEYLRRAGVDLGFARRRMHSRMPTPDEATALSLPGGVGVNEPWRILYRRGADQDRDPAVEVSLSVVRADQVVYVWRIDFEEEL